MSKTPIFHNVPVKLPQTSLGWSLLIALLLVIVGTISFIYADGLTILYRSWLSLTTPHIQLEIKPESTIIPADGNTQIYIDIQLKNPKDQLLDGTDIIVAILSGQADITKAEKPPADVSKRIFLRAPNQPQVITLSFTYKHLIKNLAIDVFDPNPPAPPTITAPTNGTNFTTATPTITGAAANDNKIEIYADGVLNTTTGITNGSWSASLQTPLKSGKHKIFVVTINKYNVRSIASPTITIDVQTPNPEIDLLNLRIKPNPTKAGTTFQIFVPISSNTKAVQLLMDNNQYPLQDTNSSSIFSGVIPAPKNPGLYRLSLIITTDSGENILAEKVASIQVN